MKASAILAYVHAQIKATPLPLDFCQDQSVLGSLPFPGVVVPVAGSVFLIACMLY